MGIWEACEYLNTLVDESDPDTDLSQIQHLMQTAEAIRRGGHPRWMLLTWTDSPTVLPKSSRKSANSTYPENEQRLAGYVNLSETTGNTVFFST